MNSLSSQSSADAAAWDAYWRDGRGAACRSDDTGLYRGVIGEYWQHCFQGLAQQSRVLDLATGNGAVLQLASKVAQSQAAQWHLFGVDLACIAPQWLAQVSGSRPKLLAGVRNEALPFARCMFDLVCSQYGAEYGDILASVTESARVLKPGGQLRWVCHWRPGSVVRGAERELQGLDFILSLQLPQRMWGLIEQQLEAGRFIADSHQRTADSSAALYLRDGLNEAFAYLHRGAYSAQSGLNVFLHNLAHLYQYREGQAPAVVRAAIFECGAQLSHHQQRLAALIQSAWSPHSLDNILAVFARCGFQVLAHGPLCEAQGTAVAYALHAVVLTP